MNKNRSSLGFKFLQKMSIPRIVISLLICCSLFSHACLGIRSVPDEFNSLNQFSMAPIHHNHINCPVSSSNPIHISMTLDFKYLRGSIAAVNSILQHASCPDNIFFHFIAIDSDYLNQIIQSIFPFLNFKLYIFRKERVVNLISSSIRQALENPLNFARNYLGDILYIDRVIYLDSDIIVVDDIFKLWNTTLTGSRVIGAPEYCEANFTNYFTDEFWNDPVLARVFESRRRKACYFNTGVMVMDLVKWRRGNYRKKIENWMKIQRKKRIYELGSLPPFLLVFGGNVEGIDHRWNQHGLGGDNVKGNCRKMNKGPFSLLHWSGKGKPWLRFDDDKPCPVDFLWEPYDLYKKW